MLMHDVREETRRERKEKHEQKTSGQKLKDPATDKTQSLDNVNRSGN